MTILDVEERLKNLVVEGLTPDQIEMMYSLESHTPGAGERYREAIFSAYEEVSISRISRKQRRKL